MITKRGKKPRLSQRLLPLALIEATSMWTANSVQALLGKCLDYIIDSTTLVGNFAFLKMYLAFFPQKSAQAYHLLPVHTLVEVLKLHPALCLGARHSNAMGTFDPFLLKDAAARGSLHALRTALDQDPAVQVYAQPLVQVHKWHGDAGGEGQEKTMGEIRRMEANEPVVLLQEISIY